MPPSFLAPPPDGIVFLMKQHSPLRAGRWLAAALMLFCLLFVPLAAVAQYPSFAIVGDTHVGQNNEIYQSLVRSIERHKIDTVIHVGDAIDKPGSEAQWAEFFAITGSGKTLYLTVGNHDRAGTHTRRAYPAYFAEPYYSSAQGDTLLVFLNTELPGEPSTITGKQLAWLESELERPFQFKFVFLHQPPFPVVPHHGLDRNAAARDYLHRLFVRKHVSLVVSGHDHLYQRTTKDGIVYVISGGGGGTLWPFTGNGFFYHYIIGARTNSSYAFRVVDVNEKVRDEFRIKIKP